MTTQNNNPTRSTANVHNGQTSDDPNTIRKLFIPCITCTHSRKKALAEGLQKKVPGEYIKQLEEDWDMLLTDHIYLTKQVIETCRIPDQRGLDEEKGRLWDVLNVLEVAIGNACWNPISFKVCFDRPKSVPDVKLLAVWTTVDVDAPTPAITVKMPDEP